jgi:molybdate transport system ATP-binding protein
MNLGSLSVKVHVESNSSSVALQAPSGSGKSTFVRTIAGLHKSAEITTIEFPRIIGYVPQDSLLIPHLSVKENLLLSPRSQASKLSEVCEELKILQLLDRKPRMLSGGEKQRVSIGRALLSHPELLILDEPFAALDFEIRDQVSAYLKEWLTKNQVNLLLITHDQVSSQFLCEEFWTIKNQCLGVEP